MRPVRISPAAARPAAATAAARSHASATLGTAMQAWRAPQRAGRRQKLACQGFLNSLFGAASSMAADKAEDAAGSAGEDWSLENLDEVLLTELQREDGSRGYIVYRNGALVDAAELELLCDKVGWPRRPQNKVQAALANSFLVATLTLEDAPPAASSSSSSSGSNANASSSSAEVSSSSSSRRNGCSGGGTLGRLVGLARCTSDGAFNATLWDVLVDPEFQGQGLGKALVEGVTRTLLRREITNITLFADGAVVDFYTQLGYAADPEGIKGMFWHPRF